jgi:3-deoxy-D-manno-octulosonate 8-phosphate phosphatase (KDO 8-P phosphatase)
MNFKGVKLLVMDFDGVIAKSTKIWGAEGIAYKICDGRDGLGIDYICHELLRLPTVVITREESKITYRYCMDHSILCLTSKDKLNAIDQVYKMWGVSAADTCYVGDDITDIEAMDSVGYPVVVRDAHISLLSRGYYVTEKCGGEGAVREVVDKILEDRRHD